MHDVLLILYCFVAIAVVYFVCQYFNEYDELREAALQDTEALMYAVGLVFMMGIFWPITFVWFCYVIFYNSEEDSYEERS